MGSTKDFSDFRKQRVSGLKSQLSASWLSLRFDGGQFNYLARYFLCLRFQGEIARIDKVYFRLR
jgi:hypothetical protein